jgi:hypothetical protein
VSDIDDLSLRIDRKDDALDGGNEIIAGAEIGEQGDNNLKTTSDR